MNKVFAVGVGPGSSKYVTDIVKDAISQCDVVIGYGYTIKTIEEFVKGKKILEVTMENQEDAYQEIAKEVHSIIRITEDEIIESMKIIWERLKIVCEPSGAPSLAAVLKSKKLFNNKKVGIIITGGNVDLNKLPF